MKANCHETTIQPIKLLQCYVDEKEYETLIAVFKASGYSSLSAFLRKKIAGSGVVIPYPKELLKKLDNLGLEHQRIGNNINQIAKKVHVFDKKGHFPAETLQQFNNAMISYLKAVNELSRAYGGLIRKFS